MLKPSKEELLQLAETMHGVDLAKHYNVRSKTVYQWLKLYDIKLKQRGYWHQFITKYDYNYKLFTDNTAISYYLLGVFITDGCMKHGKASLSSADKDWLMLIRDLICPELPLRKEPSKCWRLDITDFRIREWLITNGCIPKKSLTVKFPKIPEKYLPDFVRGCIDGDGSISYHLRTRIVKRKNGLKPYQYWNIVFTISSGSKDFIWGFIDLLNKLSINHCLTTILPDTIKHSTINGRKIIAKNIYYRISNGHNSARKILEYAYYNDNPLSMPRKFLIAQQIFKHYKS